MNEPTFVLQSPMLLGVSQSAIGLGHKPFDSHCFFRLLAISIVSDLAMLNEIIAVPSRNNEIIKVSKGRTILFFCFSKLNNLIVNEMVLIKKAKAGIQSRNHKPGPCVENVKTSNSGGRSCSDQFKSFGIFIGI